MMKWTFARAMMAAVVVSILASGCATHVSQNVPAPQPALTKLGTYSSSVVKPVLLEGKYADSGPNQKAARKIDELLQRDLPMVLKNKDAAGEGATVRHLQVEPVIVGIKFIGGAARFWVGAMAGSSYVHIKVIYTDLDTGDIIAQPEFQRVAGSMSGGWSMGGTDNMMLDQIARDIGDYTRNNMY